MVGKFEDPYSPQKPIKVIQKDEPMTKYMSEENTDRTAENQPLKKI